MQNAPLLEKIEKEADGLILQDKLRLIEMLISQIRNNIPLSNEAEFYQADVGHLAHTKGWLDEDDEFFQIIDGIIQNRNKHIPRIFKSEGEDNVSP